MNTYVMSDIHGCYDEFQQMLEKIHFSDRDLLICAGDYIDRGTKNYEMMSWISNAPEHVVFVRGNHDEEFLTNIRIMKYVCDVCGWEYDEEKGYPEGGIAPGTKWEDVPEDFECPLCNVGKDQFSEVE